MMLSFGTKMLELNLISWDMRYRILQKKFLLSNIYKIVHQFGGIYTDTDTICVKPFPKLFEQSYVSHTLTPWNNICNGNFGFPKVWMFTPVILSLVVIWILIKSFLALCLSCICFGNTKAELWNWWKLQKQGNPRENRTNLLHINVCEVLWW